MRVTKTTMMRTRTPFLGERFLDGGSIHFGNLRRTIKKVENAVSTQPVKVKITFLFLQD